MKLPGAFLFATTFGAVILNGSCVLAQTNVAVNKKVTLSIPSNYALTKDKNPAQLTDGKYAGEDYDAKNKTSNLWVQPGSITWRARKEPVVITIDLGKVTPISGVSFSTAAGAANIQFPSFVGIAVSDDGETWHYQGNLMSLSRKTDVPDLSRYSKFRFVTRDLKTKGRYVAFSVIQNLYTVTDEVEVYSGDEAWLNQSAGGKELANPAAMKDLAAASVTTTFVQRRLDLDIKAVRELLANSQLPAERKSTLEARLEKASLENDRLELADESIKTMLPINATHRDVLAVHGEVLAAQGVKPLTVWKQHRYAWLPLLAKPVAEQAAVLNFSMLQNQFRSDALLLTNASGSEKTVQLQLQNPPQNAQPGWLKIDSATWMDTYQGTPVADALLPVASTQGRYEIKVPAGFTGKVWLTVDSSKVAPGNYRSTLLVDNQQVPLNLLVSKIAMQRPRLSLGMWDYTDPRALNSSASLGINPQNYPDALKLMKSHYVDSPWSRRGILPWPEAEDFDAQNNLKNPLSFTDFDQWIAEWPEARRFFVFISAKEKATFAGAQRGTPEFNARLGNWAKEVSAHLKTKNLNPDQLALLINDEAGLHGEWQDDVIADWARAINAAAPEITLVSDPVWKRPDLQKNQDAITQMDMLMPNTQIYTGSVPVVHEYFQKQRSDGKDLWLYACIGPVRLFNPQQYYRSQAWRVFSMGGKGMGFWSFGDIGGAPTTWHEYQIARSFSPVFIDENTVHSSIHWDSVREGVQDFEELAMLRDAISATQNMTLKVQAQKILDEAVKTVIATPTNGSWQDESTPELADQQLQKVRAMLDQLSA